MTTMIASRLRLGLSVVALAALAALVADVWQDGAGRLSYDFLTGYPARRASDAGIWHALTGSIVVMVVTAALAVPIGVGAAIAVTVGTSGIAGMKNLAGLHDLQQ